ncbi:MAG: hypothetical protein LBG12_07895 [Synergistaceae bacterium]|jgi:hypothetical protein|nr:hypothetical protein [Synergistaceae bacterium]
MNKHEFECDTSECMFWNEENGCTKRTVTIQEHSCCDFEEKERPGITVVVGGAVQSVYAVPGTDVEAVEVLDFDNAVADADDPDALSKARKRLECIKVGQRQIY